ncbi:MAG: type II toxin-antitoxin system HipA family toxin [Deltaproteobacteria bacterium]|nr:MAG: type II toxin-antitoxin system HipA family toxin [Deltaproteobacteria bacterium]
MNSESVGTLNRSSTGNLEFSYNRTWLESEKRRPISLSIPLGETVYSGDRVENFFDNLLPDSQPIRNRIQTRFGAATNRTFDLLWHIGRDCVGALQLSPEEDTADIRMISSRPLTDAEIADILRNYRTMPLGMRPDGDFRISIAGAQEKTALLKRDNQWHLPQGTTPTSHILKLPIGQIEHSGLDLSDSVENEWLCHIILKAYELPVAHAEIGVFDGEKALIVERFDRRWAKDDTWLMRLPQEDMCQALNVSPSLKYESDGGPGMTGIMNLLVGSSMSLSDRRTFMTLNLLYWLLFAIDGHAKNFSIFLLQGGNFQLTPAYDVLSAHPMIAKGQLDIHKLKMAMAMRSRNKHYSVLPILYRHWLATAKKCRYPVDEMDHVISSTLERMDHVIDQVADQLPGSFPDSVAGPILNGMRENRDRMLRSMD